MECDKEKTMQVAEEIRGRGEGNILSVLGNEIGTANQAATSGKGAAAVNQ